ncbi:MAG: TlpA family protein disulfide reductase [Candidatus Magasanikbacteria bacterium]|nr:TlpA family protein disulfide reductase [Candidatus Magasanikbacteria bacterium]
MDKKTFGIILFVGVFLVVGGATVLAFGNFNSGSDPVSAYKASVAASDKEVEKHAQGVAAPNFTLPLLGGGTVSMADFRGKKPVVLAFWASWCPNCRRDMPKMNAYYEKYKDKVAVVTINMQEDVKTVADFMAAGNLTLPVALDAGSAAQTYGVQYTNTHILIDKEGQIINTVVGDIKEEDFQLLVNL